MLTLHILVGGYDDALKDNIDTYRNLRKLCDQSELRHVTIRPSDTKNRPSSTEVEKSDVVFLLNFTDNQRTSLLTASSTIALLYTPENEHFGIVPVEAMACGLPVLGVNSGGPTETIVDTDPELKGQGATGLLRRPNAQEWSEAMVTLVNLSSEARKTIEQAGKDRVQGHFSSDKLGKELENACKGAIRMGPIGLEESFVLILGGFGLMGIFIVVSGLYQIP
jgi:alpha-1,3/alpha-1,6-mannosyltransferase